MHTKSTFYDRHSVDYPIEVYSNLFSDKIAKAIYVLDDTAIEDGAFDLGIFNCGVGPDTLNKGFSSAGVYTDTPRTSEVTGRALKPEVYVTRQGRTQMRYKKGIRYPDTLQWVIHQEDDGSTWLYIPQLLDERDVYSKYARGTKAYDVTGQSWKYILEHCNKDGYNKSDVRQFEKAVSEHDYYRPREDWKQVKWCREFDGCHIIVIVAGKPKMTYDEILNVILNEGGSIDENGIVHRDN